MKKRLYLSVILLIGIVFQTMSADRTNAEMKRVANAKLQELTKSSNKTRSASDLRIVLSKPVYSVFSNGENYVFVSKRVDCPAVLAYGAGDFNLDNIPDAVKWWMNSMEESLQKGTLVSTVSKIAAISPLVTTKWGQSAPFNNYMKYFKKDGSKAPAGCVAIAMAQILNFNRYPESVSFTGSYSIDDETYTEEVNSTYSWPYNDAYGQYFPEGATEAAKANYLPSKGNAVAVLCRDCGYAIDMAYTPSGSGAQTVVTTETFVNVFKYPATSVNYHYRSLYSENEWMDLILDELRKGYPLIYSGHDKTSGGHAFVADGCDGDGLLHINWGWSGLYDGYYDFRLLNPGSDKFSEQQQIVRGIRPKVMEGDSYGSLVGTEKPFELVFDKEAGKIFLKFYGAINYCGKNIVGKVGIVFENLTNPENSDYLYLMSNEPEEGSTEPVKEEDYTLPPFYGWNSFDWDTEWDGTFPAGKYKVYLGSMDIRYETTWQMGRTVGGAFYYDMSVDDAGNVTMGAEPVLTGVESVFAVSHNSIMRTLSKGLYDLSGRNVGDNETTLRKGIYIKNGKKFFCK